LPPTNSDEKTARFGLEAPLRPAGLAAQTYGSAEELLKALNVSGSFGAGGNGDLQVLWNDGERILCRRALDENIDRARTVLAVLPVAEHPAPTILDRLDNEFALRDELSSAWAARPLELLREGGRTILVLEDLGGEPLESHLAHPMEIRRFLRLAIRMSAALRETHARGLIHKDIKPANVLVNFVTEEVWLTGFGIASRLPRERQVLAPPEVIAGTLAYMAPEQTGRMNRSIDARSDLYALGVTFYQMLTSVLPFTAVDALEWVHCHIARKPMAPSKLLATIPLPISQIVLKLLAKTAEDRYQTATSLERDLRSCLAEYELKSSIAPFALGEQDVLDRLVVPEKLYGRERELEVLLTAFDRVVTTGSPELVLVCGYSGIGKSSVVGELHKVLVPRGGLFSSGKFDQYKRDIPYATVAQSLQSLIRPLLSKSDDELARWRDAFLKSLGSHGRLITELVPELKLVIGEQPPLPDLGPQDAQRLFQRTFCRFLGVFAKPENPLVLFFDDLQWLDTATLDLIECLLTQSDLSHYLLIGAYRDNEVDATHRLAQKLSAIRRIGAQVNEIQLPPLGREHLCELITDSLRCSSERGMELSNLLHEKTGGNPFFVIQFLYSLVEEGLLTFDVDAVSWSWDFDKLHSKGYTDNVVDLLVRKLVRRPQNTQGILQQFACFGSIADTATLAIILGTSEGQIHELLWDALCQELVERRGDNFRFTHDRVREAAYSIIPEKARVAEHLRIGRLLTKHLPQAKRDEAIFEIVSQFNRSASLITSREERELVAQLNLDAGRRAKASTAYASALAYFAMGSELLGEDRWESQYELSFLLESQQAECEFITGDLAIAEERLSKLSDRLATTVERALVACLRMDLYTTLNQSDRAVEVGLDYLRHLGIEWPSHPTEEDGRDEYARIWSYLGTRPIQDLIDLPRMRDPVSLGTLDVLTKMLPPALFTDANLFSLACCRAANLSFQNGNSDGSCVAYVWLGTIAGPQFNNYEAGFQFGRLGYELVEKRGLTRFEARTRLWFAQFVVPWTKHVRDCRELMRQAFEAANRTGDLTIAGYACNNLNTNFLACGDSLDATHREAERGFAFVRKARFGFVSDIISGQLGLVRTLRGLTMQFGHFDDDQFDERQFENHLTSDGTLALPECWYWTRKLQARFFAGKFDDAVAAAVKAERLLWTTPSIFERAECYFYGALARAAVIETASPDQRQQHLDDLAAQSRQIEVWAENCPETFDNRAAMVQAEIARLENRAHEAMVLYERAIHSAQANGFVHNEALAYELAGRFYLAQGFKLFGHTYLQKARQCYLQWGAHGKVKHLDTLHPYLAIDEAGADPTGTITASIEHLDLATVVKVSQAISGEIVLHRLIDTLMRTAAEHAGAERGLLVLPRGTKMQVEAEATSDGNTLTLRQAGQPVTASTLPETVLQYVVRSGESVILGDAAFQSPYDADPYIRERRSRSILCLPLITQAKLVGALYLENNLSSNVFAPSQIAVLKLIVSQAAIALENSRLYSELQEREARIRRLVDANIIGIFIFNIEGPIIEANDAFLRMVGYDRTDLSSGRIKWTDLTAPEWRDHDLRVVGSLKATGLVQPYEKEYFRKDGSRVPVLVGAASFEGISNEGVAFVLDLTERKQAEAVAHENERRYREMQTELAHASRVATMGQLAASIAHEVNQPISATVTNAEAALRWLEREPPEYAEVRQILTRIRSDGYRAGNIVHQIRDLVKKKAPRLEMLDIGEAISEVIELTRGEAETKSVTIQTSFPPNVTLIAADRTQLQQVMMNLIMNAVQALNDANCLRREVLITSSISSSGEVTVSVSDTGPGIGGGSQRLFDPFYTTKPDGMGMGLSISRSIIESQGGKIWVTSNDDGGADFRFTLPAPRG